MPSFLQHKHVALVTVTSPLGLLWQSHQVVIATGQRRERNMPNVSETLEPGETPLEAALRGLKEELGLNVERYRVLPQGQPIHEQKPSPSTGEMRQYTFYPFVLDLNAKESANIQLSCIEGLDEGGVQTFFEWR